MDCVSCSSDSGLHQYFPCGVTSGLIWSSTVDGYFCLLIFFPWFWGHTRWCSRLTPSSDRGHSRKGSGDPGCQGSHPGQLLVNQVPLLLCTLSSPWVTWFGTSQPSPSTLPCCNCSWNGSSQKAGGWLDCGTRWADTHLQVSKTGRTETKEGSLSTAFQRTSALTTVGTLFLFSTTGRDWGWVTFLL